VKNHRVQKIQEHKKSRSPKNPVAQKFQEHNKSRNAKNPGAHKIKESKNPGAWERKSKTAKVQNFVQKRV
jgi:hypothetical protein